MTTTITIDKPLTGRQYLVGDFMVDPDEQMLFEWNDYHSEWRKSNPAELNLSREQWIQVYESLDWEIVTGEDVVDVFQEHRPGSCMRYRSCEHLLAVYINNPDQVGTLVIRKKPSGNLLCQSASALVWFGKRRVYLDRIYGQSQHYGSGLTKAAFNHLQAYYPEKCVRTIYADYGGDEHAQRCGIIFTLDHDSLEPLPWMDSVRHIVDYDSDWVRISTKGTPDRCECNNTQGTMVDGYEAPPRLSCCSCGCGLDDDDHYSEDDNTYCESCYHEAYSCCEWSEETYPSDEVSSREVYCLPYRHSRSGSPTWRTMCIADETLRYYFRELPDGRYVHQDYAIEDIDDNYHDPEDDTFIADADGDVLHIDTAVEIDGEYYHRDSTAELHCGTVSLYQSGLDWKTLWSAYRWVYVNRSPQAANRFGSQFRAVAYITALNPEVWKRYLYSDKSVSIHNVIEFNTLNLGYYARKAQ